MMARWYPSLELVSQLAHFGWGALFIVIGAFFGHFPAGWIALVVFAAVKEFIFDILVERDTWRESARDFSFWVLGGAFGTLLVFLHGAKEVVSQ